MSEWDAGEAAIRDGGPWIGGTVARLLIEHLHSDSGDEAEGKANDNWPPPKGKHCSHV